MELSVFMEYRRVWQTWNLINEKTNVAQEVVETKGESGHSTSQEEFRDKVQKYRIKRRLTIAALASMVGCESETFASYERGDEIIPCTILERLRKLVGTD